MEILLAIDDLSFRCDTQVFINHAHKNINNSIFNNILEVKQRKSSSTTCCSFFIAKNMAVTQLWSQKISLTHELVVAKFFLNHSKYMSLIILVTLHPYAIDHR